MAYRWLEALRRLSAGGTPLDQSFRRRCRSPTPAGLEPALRDFVAYYNNERYHESLDNVTPADVYFGRQYTVLTERDKIKRLTMKRRKKEYLE